MSVYKSLILGQSAAWAAEAVWLVWHCHTTFLCISNAIPHFESYLKYYKLIPTHS